MGEGAMKLHITRRGKTRQPWRWSLWYDNGEPASNSGEAFPTERHVARAVCRYLNAHLSSPPIFFRGKEITKGLWNSGFESAFVKHLVKLIRTLPPERLGTRGKGRG